MNTTFIVLHRPYGAPGWFLGLVPSVETLG